MPQGSTLLQLLRGLNKQELEAIIDRCDWCRTRKTDVSAQELSKRIRKSIDRNVERGNTTYSEVMRDIRDQVLVPGPEPVAAKIRNQLRSLPPSAHVAEIRIEEEWFSAQLYGALWASIERPYKVHLERQLNTRNRPEADVYVESKTGNGDFLIEVKLAPIENGQEVRRQIVKYHRAIEEDMNRTRTRTFLCVIGEDAELESRDGSRKSEDLSEYFNGVPSTVDEIPKELPRTEVISNTFQ
jgi:hypothetical protein